jgi:hypothetical protein
MGGIGNGTPDVVKGTDKDTDVAVVVGLDKTTRSVNTNNRVWDTDTLTWVRMEQPAIELSVGDLTVTMGDVEKLLASRYWLNVQYDYDGSGNCIYVGKNTDLSANDGDTDWYIARFDWSNGNCVQKRERITSWTSRASGW